MNKKPFKKQAVAYKYLSDSTTRIVAYGGAAGGGKSWLGCEWLMLSCFHLPGTRWFIGRNNLRDTRDSSLITWGKVAAHHGFTGYRESDDRIVFKNGSTVTLLDLSFYPRKDPYFERLGSKEFTGGWIEEAGEIHSRARDAAVSRIGRHLNAELGIPSKLYLTFNPKKNWLYRDIYLPWKKGTLPPDTRFVRSLHSDNPHLPPEYVKNLEAIKDPLMRDRLLHGLWEYDDDDRSLVQFERIHDSFSNEHVKPDPEDRWITADIALEGADNFVIGYWEGFVLVEYRIVPKSRSNEVVGAIEAMRIRRGLGASQVIFDSDGVGAFIGGFISGANSFHGGAPAHGAEKYENLKAQCFYKLADKIFAREIYLRAIVSPDEQDYTAEELSNQLRSGHTVTERVLTIVRKAEVKTSLGRSPDVADMIGMRMWPVVNPKLGKKGTRSNDFS